MILKRIQFTSTTWDKPRNVNSLGGNQTSVYVGQVVRHLKRGEVAEIGSLELDRQARMVLVRFVYSDGPNKGKPFRRLTVNDAIQPGEEADVLGLAYDDRTEFYFDEGPKAQPTAALTDQADGQAMRDPPPAKPIQQQGRGR